MIFLDYQVRELAATRPCDGCRGLLPRCTALLRLPQAARENQAQYVETDPFKTLVKDGELRQQGKEQWRLSEFLDYRGA